ncbi:uncharacterized protein [Rutidosis leptorrhynchoides]|uniref:uncharacterized protein n=1 Tax=Rutidosis leptorrhynchoides TaxID=125765 RepID=UPI003A9A5E97
MKDDEPLPISSPTILISSKKETLDWTITKRRYKFWAFTAIILLAFWSMLSGTVSLRFSAGNLNGLSDDVAGGSLVLYDLDAIELEEREKIVQHMWDVYSNGRSSLIKLPLFWREAFVAAYEDLSSDLIEVREAAISEIAKMSVNSINLDPSASEKSMNLRGLSSHSTRLS